MLQSDLKYRKWRSSKAERTEAARQAKTQKEYYKRLDALVEMIVETIRQKELNCYLVAPTRETLLLELKAEVDRRPGGFITRHPDPRRNGASAKEQGERAMFMKAAYDRAISLGLITEDTKSGDILLYSYRPPKYLLHRNGQTIVDYIPTKDELTADVVEAETEPEFVPTDRIHARFGRWI